MVFADTRFKVILEKRDKYILLITRYYIKSDYMLNKEINRAKLFEKQKTPLDLVLMTFSESPFTISK